MPRLIVKLPGGTKTVPVGDEAVSIGRTNENTLPIDDVGVSRRHAQILFIGKGYEVADLGSRNGTKVNGKKVPRAVLKGGDVLTIGGVDIVFEEDAAAGIELEELDLGGEAARAPGASEAPATMEIGPAAGAPAGDCLVRFTAGERAGTEVVLKGPRTTFGRRPTNTVSFKESAVSGVHCEITREANGYVLRDLGSTNGTTVDGEPVVETLLRHNARIRIGGERMVFVDPTVADIESALSAGDEIAEWGLMRGELDVAAARGRHGRAGLVAATVVVLAAGAGAWYVTKMAPGRVEVPPVRDNRLPDFSFEDDIVRWFSPVEEGARARIAGTPEAPRARSGVRSLEVLPQGEGPGVVEFSAAAAGGADLVVTPDTTYEVSAAVGGGSGAVVVTWVAAAREGLVREDSTPVVEGGGSWPATRAVLTAPHHASSARISLAAFGGRPAVFDDVVFRRAEGTAPPALDSGDLRVRIDATGAIEAVRGGEILLTEGGLAPSVDAAPEALLGASLSAPPALSGAALSASGTLPGGGAFRTEAKATGGGAVLSCVPGAGGGGAFTFTCPSGLARGAVTLVLEKTALVLPEQETFRQEGVRKIIVGTSEGPQPFVLSADPKSPGFAFSSRRTVRGLRVQLAPPAEAPAGVDAASVHLGVDLAGEEQGAQDLLRAARDLESQGRKGEAAAAFDRVALEYHYLPAHRDPAAKARDALRQEADRRWAEAERMARGARRFRSAPDLRKVVDLCRSIAAGSAGLPAAAKAEALAAEADAELKAVLGEAVEKRVERLYLRARDYRDNRQVGLAYLLCEEIRRIAPEGNEYRRGAEEWMPELRESLDREKKELYGVRK